MHNHNDKLGIRAQYLSLGSVPRPPLNPPQQQSAHSFPSTCILGFLSDVNKCVTQLTQDTCPMLAKCWPTVCEVGPTPGRRKPMCYSANARYLYNVG